MAYTGGPINFKVYLTRQDGTTTTPEVRRFGIDNEIVSDFQYLREKLQTIFPNIRGKRFTVSWKDFDGDSIVISSDEELQIALLETQGSEVRKFYLTLYSEYEQQGTQASASEPGVRHTGVTCDGCEKGVYGFRYKCIQCADYDLCMGCEAQSLHPEHCMLRIPVPMQWKNHYTRRLARHMNRISKTQSFYSPSANVKECPYQGTRCEPRSRQFGDSPSWMDLVATYVKDWTDVANGGCPMKETQQPQQSQPQPQSQGQSQEQPTSAAEAPKVSKERESNAHSRKNSQSDSHIEFLKNIGEHIAQFLDPLGIDVNVQVKNDKAQNTTSGTNTPTFASTSAASVSTSTPKPEAPTQSAEKIQEKTVKFPEEENLTKADDSVASGATAILNSSNESSNLEKSSHDTEGWTLLNENDSPPSTSRSSPVPSRAASVAADFTSTEATKPTVPSESTSATQPQKPLYPPLPEEGRIYKAAQPGEMNQLHYHSNPKIQRAIETMMEMGFSNEGGWLTQLLVTKDGDISKALDILAPIRR
ncbi:sequestosome-1 [Belonocnema kinseyi]|uniref:sequestosome-1 n=1 Tax=Belonocnema kinseyi TaxID=2817044 RepID=UPI00143DAD56|nr:sequestosome-1 [Belonocnema kinseyi]